MVVAELLFRRSSMVAVVKAINKRTVPATIAMSIVPLVTPLCSPDEDPCSLVLGGDLSLNNLSALDFEQHSSPLWAQVVHRVVVGLATNPLPQWTLVLPPSGLPQVFGVQHSSPLLEQLVHLVSAGFATKSVPHRTFVPAPSMSPHIFVAQQSSRLCLQAVHFVCAGFATKPKAASHWTWRFLHVFSSS